MHIEPGLVNGAKMALGAVTAAGAATAALKASWDDLNARGLLSLLARSAMATAATLVMFEVLPHHPVGISEVHLILGSSLFLILGLAPAAIGLATGLLLQGLLFAPFDLPQYGMNVTTLLAPLFGLAWLARRVVAPGTAYVDLSYAQVLKMSFAYQGGVVAWVAFWAFWGQGAAMLPGALAFGAAYLIVVLIEPLVDLALLWGARRLRGLEGSALVADRLHRAA